MLEGILPRSFEMRYMTSFSLAKSKTLQTVVWSTIVLNDAPTSTLPLRVPEEEVTSALCRGTTVSGVPKVWRYEICSGCAKRRCCA